MYALLCPLVRTKKWRTFKFMENSRKPILETRSLAHYSPAASTKGPKVDDGGRNANRSMSAPFLGRWGQHKPQNPCISNCKTINFDQAVLAQIRATASNTEPKQATIKYFTINDSFVYKAATDK
jgi:hypothetical protein